MRNNLVNYMVLDDIFEKKRFNRLALEMRKGSKKAAENLYRELVKKVFGFCVTRVGNRAAAEDITQEIFLKLVSRIELFDPKKGDFIVWFWQMARNTVIDHYRRQKETSFADLENEGEVFDIAGDNPQNAYDDRLKREKLNKLLKSFTEEEQEIFRLRFLGELSYKEMAGVLEKSEGALRVAVNRLKKKLKSNLNYGKF